MASAKNKVIAGDYSGKFASGGGVAQVSISLGFLNQLYLNKTTVESYEVITDEHRKSASSGVARGLVGGVLLGPVGLLAGGLSAKSKGIFQIAIEFKTGKRSLLEVNDKLYKAIIRDCF